MASASKDYIANRSERDEGRFVSSWPHKPAFRRPPQKAGAARLLEKADADAGDGAIRTAEGSNDYRVDFIP